MHVKTKKCMTKKNPKKTEPLEKSNMVNLKNITPNSVWDSFYL